MKASKVSAAAEGDLRVLARLQEDHRVPGRGQLPRDDAAGASCPDYEIVGVGWGGNRWSCWGGVYYCRSQEQRQE